MRSICEGQTTGINMKLLKVVAIVAASALLSVGFSAQSSEANKDQAIKSKLLRIGLTANKIEDTPIEGLKQVVTNRGVFYTSEDGSYFIAGRLFDVNSGMKNLTDLALAELRLNGIEKYKESMIVFPAENEKHVVTVFTDTTCGYCKKMHSEVEEYNKLGITIQYLAFPRGGMNSQGFDQIQAVWCSKDQQSAMTTAKAGGYVDAENCPTKVVEHYNLGQAAGVTGTPAIVLENGQLIPGYKPAKSLLADLQRSL